MKVVLDSGKTIDIRDLSFTDWRRFMSEYMSQNPYASQAWDVMGIIRGPDFPSERADMSPAEHATAYKGRRERKFNTVEILREAMFFGVVGGGARHHKSSVVILPPRSHWDHFDRHVERAARALGIRIAQNGTEKGAA